MLLLCHLPGSPGGREAVPPPVPVIAVVYVFVFVCSVEKKLIAHFVLEQCHVQCVREENVGHFTCLHLDKAKGINKKAKGYTVINIQIVSVLHVQFTQKSHSVLILYWQVTKA